MKKLIGFIILGISLGTIAHAQIQHVDPNKVRNNKGNLGNVPVHGVLEGQVTDIKIFEHPGMTGASGFFKMVNGKLTAPFPINNISFVVPEGKIAYLKMCTGDFPTEIPYTGRVSTANLTGICGIRSDDATSISIFFNGISTVIHNNDCKRVFGDINFRVSEEPVEAGAQMVEMPGHTGTIFQGANNLIFHAFHNQNANTSPPLSTTYVYNASPAVPTITTTVMARDGGEDVGIFVVGATALREGRVKILVMTNLGSAHKSCDLCDDFSSNVKMKSQVNEYIPINKVYGGGDGKIVDAGHTHVVMGPYHAHGNRDGSAITASAGTDIDFQVHFTVTGQ